MPIYNPRAAEVKWQKRWEKEKIYQTNLEDYSRPKYYNLVMFPYPSGDKLHIGHWYNFAPSDSWGRYMRMKGYNVFEPQGYDSFGLPAENYAIKSGVHPTVSIAQNIEYMRKQLREMGPMYDYDKEIVTSDPLYYQWTQWVFLQLYKKGLAYRKKAPVNWCPSCQTVLANEQVELGFCERCKHEVTKKDLTQWFFKIRDFAERLLDFKNLDWPAKTRLMQQNWIGKSIGSEIDFEVTDSRGNLLGQKIKVFTTRIDTLFGATYVVLAPEHPLVEKITTPKHLENVREYVKKTRKETDIARSSEDRVKTGVETGAYAINPVNGEQIPIWIADYVLVTYGTGAVMAVPAHDERDYAFAKKYKLPIIPVIAPIVKKAVGAGGKGGEAKSATGPGAGGKDLVANKKGGKAGKEPRVHKTSAEEAEVLKKGVLKLIAKGAFTEDGILIDSGDFTGLTSEEARGKITESLKIDGRGGFNVNYRLRDWLISRQRYWGAPIPIVYCKKCGEVPVPEEDLPVELPHDVDFTPKGDGKSPLNTVSSFVNTKCPQCGGKAEREVDTMDTFVDSSWYFLRYPSARLTGKPFDKKINKYWQPVDMYIGGPEHACMHLMYARFINMVLFDLGYTDFEEPFKRLVHQGMITKDGAKMSKSKGNVVSPDAFVEKYGSDVFRMYLMFMGPFSDGGDWNDKGITGIARFVEKFFILARSRDVVADKTALHRALHRTIKKVTEDIEKFQFNTAIAALMEFVNFAGKQGIDDESKKTITLLIAPLAPHLAEEIWEQLGGGFTIFDHSWPKFDPKLIISDTLKLPIQVNGKLRGQIEVPLDEPQVSILKQAAAAENVVKFIGDKKIIKEIYVPGRLVNFVVV
jgi:leucyl-tRNA synthetase